MSRQSDAAALRQAAQATRNRAAELLREADSMEREASVKEVPPVVFVTNGEHLSVTQAQLRFIHKMAYGAEGIDAVNVERESGCVIVQYGDERDFIDDVANVVKHEGFDPFDSDWKAL